MKKNGFTLIELLAVIVILGVIMVIAVPAVTKYIDKSKKDSYISTAQMFIDAAQKEVASGNLLAPTTSTDDPLVIPLNELKLKSGGRTSPYGVKYIEGSNVTVKSDDDGNLTYYFTAFDEKNNAIINKTDKEIKNGSSNIVEVKTPEEANIVLPLEYKVGQQVTLKDGSKYHVLSNSKASNNMIILLADYNIDPTTGYYNTACTKTDNNACAFRFDDNDKLLLDSTDTNNIDYLLQGTFLNNIKTRLSVSNVTITLPTEAEIRTLESVESNKPWVYSTSYWTKTPSTSNPIQLVVVDGAGPWLGSDNPHGNVKFGARPVITISKSTIKN